MNDQIRSTTATIELFRGGRWWPAGILRPENPQQGLYGPARFEYLTEYAVEHIMPDASAAGVSCRYPVDFALHDEPRWPAFVLDLLPSGYGRKQWVEQLDLRDDASADWPLLLRGAAFPVGNMRIAEAVAAKDSARPVPTVEGDLVPANLHPGFSRDAIAARDEHFIEYAFQMGIYGAGGSDVQGVAPKMLLVEDREGAWHADGLLPDHRVRAHWLVKMPRGRSAADRKVLKNEAAYMRVAAKMGINVHELPVFEGDCLFIPRFDRRVLPNGRVERSGMESLCSLVGISDFGVPVANDLLCRALIRYTSAPADAVLEYIRRDILNVVLGNKDNHARNTAVLRFDDGRVVLAPLFDFAPMYLDPEGIARVCRWEGDAEQAGNPEWGRVLEHYTELLPDAGAALREYARPLRNLQQIMRDAGVDDDIIENRSGSIEAHARQLAQL